MTSNQKITTFLWFDSQAEEAAKFYTSIFKDSKIISTMLTPPGPPGTPGTPGTPGGEGKVLLVTFQLAGQPFMAMNGGPGHPLTDAVSLLVDCETQQEVDELWSRLTADGGAPIQCGWLRDRFGLSWQITPGMLLRSLFDKDPEKAGRVMQAMCGMVKIDIAGIQAAYDGR
jgi:predicted 3-demethylubiquinone-9 3-methyltransferase (glyoxalase superfamily)